MKLSLFAIDINIILIVNTSSQSHGNQSDNFTV